MRLLITQHTVGKWAAYYIYKKYLEFKPSISNPFVLGLPTGATPLSMYSYLIKLYQKKLISFKNIITFNLDEYVGLDSKNVKSYYHYMQENFFKHIDINPNNIFMLNGVATDLEAECRNFENSIQKVGGINILVAGVGDDGHIAFNEPGSSFNSITRIKTLNFDTILANSRFFDDDIQKTPTLALTMGIKTILSAKEIIILANGLNKSHSIAHAIEGAIASMCPISALQFHDKALVVCDELAAFNLKLKTVRYFENIHDEYTLINDEFEQQIIDKLF